MDCHVPPLMMSYEAGEKRVETYNKMVGELGKEAASLCDREQSNRR